METAAHYRFTARFQERASRGPVREALADLPEWVRHNLTTEEQAQLYGLLRTAALRDHGLAQ